MKTRLNPMWFIFALWIGFTAGFCGAAPTSQPIVVTSRGDVGQWLQAILDTANSAGLKVQAIKAFYADGSTVTVNPVVVTPPATQPFTTKLVAGKTYGGSTVKLMAPVIVPAGGNVTVQNCDFTNATSGGVTGSSSMAAFVVGDRAILTLKDCTFAQGQQNAVINLSVGGWVSIQNTKFDNGALLWCSGGKFAEVFYPTQTGTPDKYVICNFSNQLDKLVIVSDKAHPIRQGKHEACVRLMQVDDAQNDGLAVIGSGFKQAVQDRPGGKPGSVYSRHLWRNCTITGGLDLGNFKDRTDANFPFGVLKLSRWENCSIDRYATTAQGANPIGKAMGIDAIQFVNCTINAKPVTTTITR